MKPIVRFTTASGTSYFIFEAEEAIWVQRELGEASAEMRKDGETLELADFTVEEASAATLVLEPLSQDADVTFRFTSPVQTITRF